MDGGVIPKTPYSIIDIFFQSAGGIVNSLFPGLHGAPQTAKASLRDK